MKLAPIVMLTTLSLGWISDKVGRKFGMASGTTLRSAGCLMFFPQMSATAIVAFFSALSAASSGANHSVHGLLAMLITCRCVGRRKLFPSILKYNSSSQRFFLGIGIGAEYPCGSVSASEQTEGKAISKNAQHRWFALATSTHPSRLVLHR